jgi:tetratricopeptide (TPR) repeat protein
MKVESVAWIMQGKDTMFSMFYLLTILLYLKHIKVSGFKKLAIFAIIIIAATMSSLCKIQALTLPLALFLIDWWNNEKLSLASIAEKFLIFLLMFNLFDFYVVKIILLIIIISGYFSYWDLGIRLKKNHIINNLSVKFSHLSLKKKMIFVYLPTVFVAILILIQLYFIKFQFLWSFTDSPEYVFYDGFQRIFLAAYSLCFYFLSFFFPYYLNNFHAIPEVNNNVLPLVYYLSIVIIITIVITLILFINKQKDKLLQKQIVFSLLFFLLTLLPVVNIFDMASRVIVADRYLYLGSIGLSFFAVSLFNLLISKFPKYRFGFYLIISIFIISNIFYSNSRSYKWKSSESFWTEAYLHNPNSYYVLFSMGNVQRDNDNPEKAIRYYSKAVKQRADLPFLFLNLADSYLLTNKPDSSLIYYYKATQIYPDYFDARFNMSIAFLALKDTANALEELAILEKLHSEESKIFHAEAKIFSKTNPEKALEKINKAINIRIDNDNYYSERAGIYIDLDKPELAIDDITKALSINENNDMAYFFKGLLLLKSGETSNARENFKKALNINPKNSKASEALKTPETKVENYSIKQNPEELINQAVAFAKASNFEKAIELLDQAVRLDPKNYIAFKNRGNVFANINKFDEAINDYDIALKLKPNAAGTFLNRGSAKLKKNDMKGACNDWKSSSSLGNKNATQLLSKHCK